MEIVQFRASDPISHEVAIKLSARAMMSSEGPTGRRSPFKLICVVVGRI